MDSDEELVPEESVKDVESVKDSEVSLAVSQGARVKSLRILSLPPSPLCLLQKGMICLLRVHRVKACLETVIEC